MAMAYRSLVTWKIHPTIPILMVGNFLLGNAIFVAHHYFYVNIHSQRVLGKETIKRTGLGRA